MIPDWDSERYHAHLYAAHDVFVPVGANDIDQLDRVHDGLHALGGANHSHDDVPRSIELVVASVAIHRKAKTPFTREAARVHSASEADRTLWRNVLGDDGWDPEKMAAWDEVVKHGG